VTETVTGVPAAALPPAGVAVKVMGTLTVLLVGLEEEDPLPPHPVRSCADASVMAKASARLTERKRRRLLSVNGSNIRAGTASIAKAIVFLFPALGRDGMTDCEKVDATAIVMGAVTVEPVPVVTLLPEHVMLATEQLKLEKVPEYPLMSVKVRFSVPELPREIVSEDAAAATE
jgi:hypothetical protein